MAGKAGLEADGDPGSTVFPVHFICQIYAVRYAGSDLFQHADTVLRCCHELLDKREQGKIDRHVCDLGVVDIDAAVYAAVSGAGLLFLDP